LDIRAQDQFNRWYDLEMQMLAQMFFRERVLFYLAKYYSQQLGEGQRYDKLTPVHGVFFLNANEWKDDRYHRVFCLRDLSTGAALNEHLFMHFIELPKFNLKLDELKTPREIWCYFLKHSTSLDPDNLPSQLTSEPIKRALEVLLMLSRNPLEALQYEAILRAQADQEIREEAVQRTSKREGAKTSLRTLVEAKFGIEHGALIDRLGANVDLATLQKLVAEVARANSLEQILPLFPTP
jgi:predicted transposase/invertase (TIGR01784 family)